MKTIRVRNVHDALPEALHQLSFKHESRDSRNGPVWVSPLPGVATTYLQPCERVLFWPDRDANPFFHFMESLWMLGGRDDVAWIQQFNSRFGQFSDDGKSFHGAYGYRWREHFGLDQLEAIAKSLEENRECRRQVLSMWDPQCDLDFKEGKDLPCNTHCYFQVDGDLRLHLLVSCRSNDIIWGCYGANAVHFSTLLEYMASRMGYEVGTLTQVSFNWHGYLETMQPLLGLADYAGTGRDDHNPYTRGDVSPFPLMSNSQIWDKELQIFLEQGDQACYKEEFFEHVAVPMLRAWRSFKRDDANRFRDAKTALRKCQASDWRRACWEWVERRETC